MPKRVNQHEIEDISRARFQLAIPRKWVFRDKAKDYGIDGEVELFSEENTPEGLVFWVQLKATESKDEGKVLNVDFSIETLKYYKTLDIPVLLVRYSDYNESIYVKWIHNVDLFFAKEKGKTFRIKLNEDNKWTDTTASSILKYLKNIRRLKSGLFSFPLPFSLSIEEDSINKISKGIIETQIKRHLEDYSDFIILSTSKDSLVNVELSNSELKINISELAGCSFHSIETREPNNFALDIVKDILLGISVGLNQLGNTENSGKIIFGAELQNRLLDKTELLQYLLIPLFNTSYFAEVLNLVSDILDSDNFLDLNILTQINLLIASRSKSKEKHSSIKTFLENKLEKSIKEGDNDKIGISHYNIGNYFMSQNRTLESLSNYNLARKFAPIYLNQHYFYREIAGVLFQAEKYTIASKLYQMSLDIKYDIQTQVLYADALLFKGEYRKAMNEFRRYSKECDNPTDEFILKTFCLENLLSKFKIESQVRNTKKANMLAAVMSIENTFDSKVIRLENALTHDLLSNLTWFNLGMSHSENNNFDDACFCFTMAGLAFSGDIEAWKNATLCAFNVEELTQFLPLIIRTGFFYNREEYLEELYTHLASQNDHSMITHIIDAVNSVLPKKEKENGLPTVRLLDNDGKFKNLEEIAKGHNNR